MREFADANVSADADVPIAATGSGTPSPLVKPMRQSVTLLPKQDDALDRLAEKTGASRGELIRQAINLLSITKAAEDRGLFVALANDDNTILTRLVSI